jgi:hypothetical protein
MKDTKKSAKSTAARFTDEDEPPSARGSPQTDFGRGGCRVLNRARAGRPVRGSPVGRFRYILFAGSALRSAPAAGV